MQVAIHKQHASVLGLSGQEVAYGRPACVLLPLYISAAGQLAYEPVLVDGLLACGTIVGHEYLVLQSGKERSLTLQFFHQGYTHVVVCRQQNGNLSVRSLHVVFLHSWFHAGGHSVGATNVPACFSLNSLLMSASSFSP